MTVTDAASMATAPTGRFGRARVAPALAAVQRVLYGKAWQELACGDDTLQVRFQATDLPLTELQCRLRCAGREFELQFADPAALFDLGAALTPGVPAFVQLAAVLHAAEDVLVALEQRFGGRIEVLGLNGPAPAWAPDQAVSLQVTRKGQHAGSSVVLLRALQHEGWQALQQAALGMTALPTAHDPLLDLALMADAVPLALAELRQLAAGDVLLLKASTSSKPGKAVPSVEVSLRLGAVALPDLRATRAGSKLRITQAGQVAQAVARAMDALSSALADARATPESLPPRSTTMISPDAGNALAEANAATGLPASTLDAVEVEVGLSLGSVRMSLSTLRKLAVGQVHEAGGALDGESVVLWCGGQRLGLGQLVELGEQLGVRIVALDQRVAGNAATGMCGAA